MTEDTIAPQATDENHGWRVTFAGMGINLALGILYTWSVISKGVPEEWNWNETYKSWPYMIACLVFCIVMVPAGRMQDKIGPRVVASLGGVLVGIGFIIASMTTTLLGFIIGFGVLAGAGIGFGYASATPPAIKWFPSTKTGLIAGIVVSGFGLASVYAAPLAKWLIVAYSFKAMLLTLGIAFLIIVVGLAQILKPPPKGYVPAGAEPAKKAEVGDKKEDFLPREMFGTVQFYMIWFMYACGAGAGLMIIAKLATIAKLQANVELGFVFVALLAIGNGGGRIASGMLSDKIGRKATMFICFVSQAIFVLVLSRAVEGSALAKVPVLVIISVIIGANYGANLSLFPSITKDYYGLKNFGTNYGFVFTAWGVGGFMLAFLAGKIYDIYHKFEIAYYGACGLLILAAIVTLFIRAPHHAVKPAEAHS